MLNICENFAESHNLKFSTNPNPLKSKTKCIAFLRKSKVLPNLKLCGYNLPWVDKGLHLGTKIVNIYGKLLNKDILEKRAEYIQRNNELMQEFSYAHSDTKININNIYNSHFYGSVLWNLGCREADMIYNTWNSSIRKMLRLDRTTHRYLIEPLSNTRHIKISLMERFRNFSEKLSTSSKTAVKYLHYSVKNDCRSITGMNTRRNLLTNHQTNKNGKIQFVPIPPNQQWRINFIKDLLDIRDGLLSMDTWERMDIDDTLYHLCTS